MTILENFTTNTDYPLIMKSGSFSGNFTVGAKTYQAYEEYVEHWDIAVDTPELTSVQVWYNGVWTFATELDFMDNQWRGGVYIGRVSPTVLRVTYDCFNMNGYAQYHDAVQMAIKIGTFRLP